MTDNTNDHAETIAKARDLLDKVTPGRWVAPATLSDEYALAVEGIWIADENGQAVDYPTIFAISTEGQEDIQFNNAHDAAAIVYVPDLLAALVALADELVAVKAQLEAVLKATMPTEWVSREDKPCPECEYLGERARYPIIKRNAAPRLAGDGDL